MWFSCGDGWYKRLDEVHERDIRFRANWLLPRTALTPSESQTAKSTPSLPVCQYATSAKK